MRYLDESFCLSQSFIIRMPFISSPSIVIGRVLIGSLITSFAAFFLREHSYRDIGVVTAEDLKSAGPRFNSSSLKSI